MKNSTQLLTVFTFSAVIAGSILVFGALAHAANPFASIHFPITELGSCADLSACKTYCDDAAHSDACQAYAEAHGLTHSQKTEPKKDTSSIDTVLKNGGGPGGCTSESTCRTYCSTVTHIKECIAFGKAHHLLSSDDGARADKMISELETASSSMSAHMQMNGNTEDMQRRMRMGSSSPRMNFGSTSPRMFPPRFGSSTPPLGSTTSPRGMPQGMGSDVNGSDMHGPMNGDMHGGDRHDGFPPPPQSGSMGSTSGQRPPPPPGSSVSAPGIGATVLSAFLRLFGVTN